VCRDDLDDDVARALAIACDELAVAGETLPADVRRSLRMPIDPSYLFTETAIPLHPAVAEVARERGRMPAEVAG
jgi:hypothetical protein